MPSYYPVYLNLEEQRCVVVGGGYEAERKVQGLLESGAQVTVISPEVTTILHDIANRGLIDWKRREYQPGDLEEAFLVVAENTEPRVYKEVACEAQQRRQLLNVVDVTHLCNFIAPAIVRREDVTFAISTSGLSPPLARRLREELEQLTSYRQKIEGRLSDQQFLAKAPEAVIERDRERLEDANERAARLADTLQRLAG